MRRAHPRREWQAQPHGAWLIRLVVFLVPLAAAVGASLGVAAALPPPESTEATLLWWLAVLGAGALASHLTTKIATSLLPLALLLRLTLTFPERAPNRYRLARDAWSVRRAREALEGMDEASPDQRAAEAALALIAALEAHDRATRGHSERVRLLTELIGDELGLSAEDVGRLRWAALLHDLGKLNVHPDILNKDGRPSDAEWEALLRHPEEGAALARPLRPWLGDWALALAEHHERHDGTGYPHGLRGEEISLAGRIVAVADAYEAMTAHRSYSRPRSGVDARGELVAGAGAQFHPDVVHAFLRVSLPRRLRGAAPIAWLLSLPVVGWLRRLPAGPTAVAAGTVAALVGVGAVGLFPVPSAPDAPPAVAAPEASEPERSPEDQADPSVDPDPANTADASPSESEQRGVKSDGATPGSDPDRGETPEPDDATPSPAPSDDRPAPPSDDEPAPPSDDEPAPPSDDEPAPPAGATPVNASPVTRTLYLLPRVAGDTAWRPELDLGTDEPSPGDVPNYDRDRDDLPGLTLRRGDNAGPRWLRSYASPTVVVGSLAVVVHVDAEAGASGALHAVLSACDADGEGCRPIAEGSAVRSDWGAGGAWAEHRIDLGSVSEILSTASVLALSFTADTTDDLRLAFGTAEHASRLEGLVVEPLTLLAAVAPSVAIPSLGVRGPHRP